MTAENVGPKGCINLEPGIAWQRSFRSVQSPDRQLGHESSPSVGGLKLCDIGPLDKSVHPTQLVSPLEGVKQQVFVQRKVKSLSNGGLYRISRPQLVRLSSEFLCPCCISE